MQKTMQKIIIIGAGPAGLLLAHYLLRRGNYQIEIYERRPDPRSAEQSKQRTFPIALQTRGLDAIRVIPGLESALTQYGIWSYGVLIYSKRGKPRKIKRKTPSLAIDRQSLTLVLLEELLNSYSEADVKVKFDCNCIGVEKEQQTVTLQNQEETFTANFDRLIGADGSRSQVRETLASAGYLNFQQELVPDAYKSLSLPRINLDKNIELPGNIIHTWTIEQGIRLIMAPQKDNWLSGTIIFPPEKNPLENLTTGEAVLEFFAKKAPILRPLMTLDDAETLRQKPVSRILTVKCDRLNVGGAIALIGDAVHAVSPSIGQGCNSSLQDVMILSQVLDEYQDDWEKALPVFTTKRLADIHALRDLSDFTFPRSKRMFPEFIFRMTLGKKLRPWFPQIFRPLPMELIMEGDAPYSEVLEQTQGWVDRVRSSMG
ncbi:MAG: FAD-dependent oxidoreductase [Mastigocoleus sp.]